MLEKIDLNKKISKKEYKKIFPRLRMKLYALQKASWDAEIPVIILFEGWDAAGKGTSIQNLTSKLDPRGFKLYPVRAARTYESKRPWLWRFWLKIPGKGEWVIFDRSWYGRTLVERVEGLRRTADVPAPDKDLRDGLDVEASVERRPHLTAPVVVLVIRRVEIDRAVGDVVLGDLPVPQLQDVGEGVVRVRLFGRGDAQVTPHGDEVSRDLDSGRHVLCSLAPAFAVGDGVRDELEIGVEFEGRVDAFDSEHRDANLGVEVEAQLVSVAGVGDAEEILDLAQVHGFVFL